MVMLAWRPCQSTNTEFPKLVGRTLSQVSYRLAVGLPIKSTEIRFGFSRFPPADRQLLLGHCYMPCAKGSSLMLSHFGSPAAASIVHAIMDGGLGRAVVVHHVLVLSEPIYHMKINYHEGVSHHQP